MMNAAIQEEDYFPITLNGDQEDANQSMQDFYHTAGEYFYLLEGFAGTGKSTTIQHTIKELQDQHPNLNVCFAATTNKAVKVLREMAQENDLEVTCATIHSILGLILSVNGEEKFTAKMADGSFDEFNIVVIDEISMASKYLWSVIESHAHQHKVKVIIMGDKNQLPPVKEGETPAFAAVDRSHRLTEVMRVSDIEGQERENTIKTLTAELRSAVEFGTPFEIVTNLNDDGTGVNCVNAKTFALWVEENFKSEEYAENPNAFRCLAWTNKRVNTMNRRLRKLLVGVTVSPFIAGERVIARQPILGVDEFTGSSAMPVIKTDEECKVLDIYETMHPGLPNEQFKVWAVDLLSDMGVYETAYILHEDSEHDHQMMLNKLSKTAKNDHRQWQYFWAFKDMFADLHPPHAMTVHRSQGSTYNNVFIDIVDIGKNRKEKERNQLLYVGCSRASENLVIMDRIL